MAESLSVESLRRVFRSKESLNERGFDVLRSIASLLADPDKQLIAHEMVLRALERRDCFLPYIDLLNGLVRSVGLYPYLEPEELGLRDTIAYEFHRPTNMPEGFVFHKEQGEIFRRILDGDSVIVSAPTSFGKSRIIDALIASERFKNLAIIVPTLALIDETRRRLSQFSYKYKIVTHPSQKGASKNIFVFTAERAVAYSEFPPIDFFAIDEFYKIDAMSEDETRTVALNQAFYKLKKFGGQFYLLGPCIEEIPEGITDAFKCFFYKSHYTTVVSEQYSVAGKDDDIARLLKICKSIEEPTLIFCKSPARVNTVARELLDSGIGCDAVDLAPAADWIARNYHREWIFAQALTKGIGIHHGKLPRALSQYIVRLFNDLQLKFLICTSTLIEGVNTKAKNVIVFDNKIAKKKIDFFTFNNIKGRSGRMFEHFVGRVFLFNEPPDPELPFVDFPLYTQDATTPNSLLVQMEEEDLVASSKERVRKFYEKSLLPLSVLRENSSIDPDAQIKLAKHLLDDLELWAGKLNWSGFPKYKQLGAACELIWDFFVMATRGRGGVFSAKMLTLKIWRLFQEPKIGNRILRELDPGQYAAKSADEAVERVLDFERTWANFELPRYLMALSRIQRAIFEQEGLSFGDYSFFASKVESYFQSPAVAALDEYGIPIQVGMKISDALGEGDDLDVALSNLARLQIEAYDLEGFEIELIEDARKFLTVRQGL